MRTAVSIDAVIAPPDKKFSVSGKRPLTPKNEKNEVMADGTIVTFTPFNNPLHSILNTF